jgi:hypothetical protein
MSSSIRHVLGDDYEHGLVREHHRRMLAQGPDVV